MKWFQYRQNNSGGRMVVNDRVSDYVLIQARDGSHADERAESIGIYFNGVEDGMDCECCGDRWYPTKYADNKGDETPRVYNRPPDDESATRIYPIGCDKPVSIADALKKSWVIEPS